MEKKTEGCHYKKSKGAPCEGDGVIKWKWTHTVSKDEFFVCSSCHDRSEAARKLNASLNSFSIEASSEEACSCWWCPLL